MKRSVLRTAVLGALLAVAGGAFAQALPAGKYCQVLKPNQTIGFGANHLLRFTYTQSYDCVDQPRDDRNYNGVKAERDPGEFQTPICQVGVQSTIDPTGIPVAQSEPLYVLVPFFGVDHNPNDAFTPALGHYLMDTFGFVPEGFRTHPAVPVQCPDPGSPPGSCTMHASRVDLFPLLAALKKLPAKPAHNVFVPTPNHDHVINNDAINDKAIWWQVIPVLVTDPTDWPNAAGTVGITSTAKLKRAERAGSAIETPSNFFLFFSSKDMAKSMDNMTSMAHHGM